MINSPILIYQKILITDWEKLVHTYTNISFFNEEAGTTIFKWQETPESEVLDITWNDNDFLDILKVPVLAN